MKNINVCVSKIFDFFKQSDGRRVVNSFFGLSGGRLKFGNVGGVLCGIGHCGISQGYAKSVSEI